MCHAAGSTLCITALSERTHLVGVVRSRSRDLALLTRCKLGEVTVVVSLPTRERVSRAFLQQKQIAASERLSTPSPPFCLRREKRNRKVADGALR